MVVLQHLGNRILRVCVCVCITASALKINESFDREDKAGNSAGHEVRQGNYLNNTASAIELLGRCSPT